MSQKSITNFFKPLQENKRKIFEEPIQNNKKLCSSNSVSSSPAKTNSIQCQIDSLTKITPVLSPNIGHSWFLALKGEFSKPYFKKLSDFVVNERKSKTIYPPSDEVYSWTQFSKINEVKVIILGQDPYHGPKQAHGIAFSVKKGVPPPPSLVNIYKEVKANFSSFVIPKHGDLTGWAKQGVLMLNACLTVQASNANSHSDKGWEQLTDAVIKHFNSNYGNRVFLLWGAYAQKKGSFIDQTVHPSPLSAHRGFLGCGHFKQANDYLKNNGHEPIDWTKLD